MRHRLFAEKDTREKAHNVTLAISRPHAKNINGGVIATGQYNVAEGRWAFSCQEPETVRWLDTSFAQPVNVVGGNLPIDSMDFVVYIRDVVMHRRGLVMEIK